MTNICLISKNNGWGLSKDVLLLKSLLIEAGHKVKFQEHNVSRTIPGKFNVNVHLELVGGRHFRNARYNWLIPNQEWFMEDWVRRKNRFSKVLCKTHHAVDIFKGLGFNNVKYLGFTTSDVYNPNIARVKEFVHLSGNSWFKGTVRVVEAWARNPHWPTLHVYNAWADFNERPDLPSVDLPNVKYTFGRVPEAEIREIQNKCIYHIQPSAAEGYGHVIWEGLAIGAVVISTDAPPMNEIPNLIKAKGKNTKKYNYGTLYDVDVDDLITKVESVLTWGNTKLLEHGATSRQAYITAAEEFKGRLINEFK